MRNDRYSIIEKEKREFYETFVYELNVTIQYPVKYILIFRQNRENKISVSSSF